jgi:hypothetical protein
LRPVGFGRCIEYRKYNTSIRRYANQTVDRIQPAPINEATGTVPEAYEVLDVDGSFPSVS